MENTRILLASIFLCFSIFFLMLYLILLTIFNQFDKKGDRLSFLNSYAFEFHMQLTIQKRILLYLLLSLSLLLSTTGLTLYFSTINTVFAYCVCTCFIIGIFSAFFSNVIPFTNYKLHIILAIVSFITDSIAAISMAFSTTIYGTGFLLNIPIPISVLFGIFGFSLLLSLFNPKMFLWNKKYKVEEDGKTYYIKPKINFFALTEWINLLVILIYLVLFFLLLCI